MSVLYCFTDFERDSRFYEELKELCTYILATDEVTKEGNLHYQSFCRLKKKTKLETFKKLIYPRHHKPCAGDALQNYKYCTKTRDEDIKAGTPPSPIYLEWGTFPKHERNRSDLQSCMEDIQTGMTFRDFQMVYPGPCARYWAWVCRTFNQFAPKRSEKPEVHIFWGESNSGKSHQAIEAGAQSITLSPDGRFANNYYYNEIVLFDEYDHRTMPLKTFLRITDKWDITVEVKGADMRWMVKKIYITSQFHPRTWYNLEGELDIAFQRRITSVTEWKRSDNPSVAVAQRHW